MTRPTMSKSARRTLGAIYDLVDGRTDRSVSQSEVFKHVAKLGIMRMSDPEFEQYRQDVIARVRRLRKETFS